MRIGSRAGTDGGIVTISDAATSVTKNTFMTTGLTINQGAADNEILAFKSSDVSHNTQNTTNGTEADTFGQFKKREGPGGLLIAGFMGGSASNNIGVTIRSVTEDEPSTNKSGSAYGSIQLHSSIDNGGSPGNVSAIGENGNLVSIDNAGTVRFIFDAEGSGHAEVEWVAFDDYDDLALISEIESELLKVESSAGTANRHMLEKTGIIGKDSWHMENGRPRAMVNMTRLSMLHHGALMQAADKIKTLESRLLAIEGAK